MVLSRETVVAMLQKAEQDREKFQQQFNACSGFIQACERILAEMDKPDAPAET